MARCSCCLSVHSDNQLVCRALRSTTLIGTQYWLMKNSSKIIVVRRNRKKMRKQVQVRVKKERKYKDVYECEARLSVHISFEHAQLVTVDILLKGICRCNNQFVHIYARTTTRESPKKEEIQLELLTKSDSNINCLGQKRRNLPKSIEELNAMVLRAKKMKSPQLHLTQSLQNQVALSTLSLDSMCSSIFTTCAKNNQIMAMANSGSNQHLSL